MKLQPVRIILILAALLVSSVPAAGEKWAYHVQPDNPARLRTDGQKPVWIRSSETMTWKSGEISLIDLKDNQPDITITDKTGQVIDGFGVCFNELGWAALSVLDEDKKQEILKELFNTETGLRLNVCRMPIGANDYALDYYSLNDSAGDFDMNHFNIERDKANLIPYIRSAMKFRPDLEVWGSPWCPPSWMKTNNHYACRPDIVNDMTPDQAGKEGITQFRMTPEYLSAYALYFVKYVQAYRDEGINITAIHPQNEMNSCQNFPSCIWTATDLGHFIGKYLGPALKKSFPDMRIWYGTYERPWVEKIDTILSDPESSAYVSGVSFQWAGKEAIPGIHKKYPNLKLMQSETECGDGSNDWKAAEYTFSLMKHYFDNGVSLYTFWNSILNETGKSMWGWKQNSLITIDSKTGEVRYNPEFYLLKHFSAFINPGARLLEVSGMKENVLAFRNPDGNIVIIAGNTSNEPDELSFGIRERFFTAEIPPHSFNTFIIPTPEPEEEYMTEEDYLKMTKYDVHCHISTDRPVFMQTAIANNFRILTINTDAGTPIDDQQKYAVIQKEMFPDRIEWLATFSLKDWDKNGWKDATIARIKKSMKLGARGVKVWKNIGMVEKDADGKFIMIDNPKLDPIFDYLAANRIPVLGHLGEPKNCWLPLEEMTVNNDRSYFKEHPEYHMYLHPDYPSYDEQMHARDNMLRKHTDLVFTGAHLASLEWSIDEISKRLDEFPGMTVELAARICHVQYQAQSNWQKVRDFFIKYQDRIMYGTDSGDDGERDAASLSEGLTRGWKQDWKYFTTDEIMTSPDVNGEFRGLKLPKVVIEKLYYKNAARLFQ